MKKIFYLTVVSVMAVAWISACSGGKQKSTDIAQIATEAVAEPVIPEMTVTNIVVNGFFPTSNNSNYDLIAGTSEGDTIKTESDIKKWFDGTYSSVIVPQGQSIEFSRHADKAVCLLQKGSHLLYKVIFDDKTYEVKLEQGMKLKYKLSPEGYAKIIFDTAYCKTVNSY
jgi:hypothetical protein